MSRLVILGRHGNTFNTGEKVVMVGASQDPPLTEVGRQQARAVGAALRDGGVRIDHAYAGPLKRTQEFTDIVVRELASSIEVATDVRLTELDYGAWGGLSDQEIIALSGIASLEAWQQRGIRPTGITFLPSSAELERETRAFLADLAKSSGVSLVITSNGRLRELGRLLGDSPERSWKVGTGKLCVLRHNAGEWHILLWDVVPERLVQELARMVA